MCNSLHFMFSALVFPSPVNYVCALNQMLFSFYLALSSVTFHFFIFEVFFSKIISLLSHSLSSLFHFSSSFPTLIPLLLRHFHAWRVQMSTRGKSLLNSFECLLLEAPRDQALRMLWDQRLDEVRTSFSTPTLCPAFPFPCLPCFSLLFFPLLFFPLICSPPLFTSPHLLFSCHLLTVFPTFFFNESILLHV